MMSCALEGFHLSTGSSTRQRVQSAYPWKSLLRASTEMLFFQVTQPRPMDGPLASHSGPVWSACGKPRAQRTIKEAGGVSNQSRMVPPGVSLARLSQTRIPLQSHRAVWPHAPGSPSALKEKPYDVRRGHRIGKGRHGASL